MPEKKLKTQKSKVKTTAKKVKAEKKSSSVITRSKATRQSKKDKIVTPGQSSIRSEVVQSSLNMNVLDIEGKLAGSITLPEAIFGAKVNPTLMAQAVRVYLANQRQGNASTKTRGEVTGSTRKIYKQKGTGRARHGAVRAPIFVKGGIAHGPHPRDYSLSMPAKMKRAALFSALTSQLKSGNVVVVTGLEKLEKTKKMAAALHMLGVQKKPLVVMPHLEESVYKAGRNIQHVSLMPASQLSTYAVLNAGKIVLMKDAVAAVEKTFIK